MGNLNLINKLPKRNIVAVQLAILLPVQGIYSEDTKCCVASNLKVSHTIFAKL